LGSDFIGLLTTMILCSVITCNVRHSVSEVTKIVLVLAVFWISCKFLLLFH